MIEFKPVTLESKKDFEKALSEDRADSENYSFGTCYLWGEYYCIDYAMVGDCLLIRYRNEEPEYFVFPLGGTDEDKKNCIEELKGYCKALNIRLYFTGVTERTKTWLEKFYPNHFEIKETRNYFEYVYSRDRLITLDGNEDLNRKRNLVEAFKNQGKWEYKIIDDSNKAQCAKLADGWLKSHKEPDDVLLAENKMIKLGLSQFEEIGLFGGAIYLNDKMVGFCFAEKQNEDTVIVHIEKAVRFVQGAYQTINYLFVLNSCKDFKYINREDDNGSEGLRTSKMSYHPDYLQSIYSASLIQ